MIRDKKGIEILSKEVIIYVPLALIAIGLFALLIAKLWGFFVPSTEKEQAQGMLTQISDTLASIGDGDQQELYIYSPNEWTLMTFSNGRGPGIILPPNNCPYLANCICLCEDNECSKQNYCITAPKPLKRSGANFQIPVPNDVLIINRPDAFNAVSVIGDVVNEGEVQVTISCSGQLISLTRNKCYIDTNNNDKCVRESIKPYIDAALAVAADEGIKLTITSAYRTEKMQQSLWEKNGKNSTYVCKPSPSCPHQTGCALDVCFGSLCDKGQDPHLNNADAKKLEKIMTDAGFVRYANEYWHFEYGTTRWQICKAQGEIVCV